MAKKTRQKIGEPAEQWPKLSAVLGQRVKDNSKVVDGSTAEVFPESNLLPDLLTLAGEVASALHGTEIPAIGAELKQCVSVDYAETKRVADAILGISSVIEWIEQGVDHEQRDQRACSLVTASATALRNAKQPFVTPAAHRDHYIELADRLERKLTGRPLAKLRKDLSNEKAIALRSASESDDLGTLAAFARAFAGACDNPNWTSPRPDHDQAERNDFIRTLTDWQRAFTGSPSHVLTADITTALFTDQSDEVDRRAVERLTRVKKLAASK